MKYVVILGDGMADYPNMTLGGRTPLEVANKPNIDDLSKRGKLGLVKTVPDGMKPGSDVANLSMMGYAPDKYYTGRSPLEALSIGIDLKDSDVAIRCNLVTLSDEENFADKTMVDYSAGEISTEEAKQLIEFLQQNLGDEYIDFYSGVSYRHCLVAHNAELGTEFTPPHDISDKKITDYLPKGEYGDIFLDIMVDAYKLLKDHPINQNRIKQGLHPANSIWLWGEGTRPNLTPFEEKYGIKGAVISAVDLIKGIGKGAKMKVIEVEGATGTYTTNFKGKAESAIKALKDGYDYVYIHMEAPDECGHQGDVDNKVKSIELIDSIVVKYVKEQLDLMNEDYKILIAPDHPTPLKLKTHTSDPVPFIIYSRKAGENQSPAEGASYSEESGAQTGLVYSSGEELMNEFLHGDIASQNKDENSADENTSSANEVIVSSEKQVEKVNKDDKKKNKDKQDKPKGEKKKLGKKGIIAIIASICLVGVLLAIILPVVFFTAPRIFVKNADGFKAENINSSKADFVKYFFVLDKNITCDGNLTLDDSNLHSIDFNKHTLNVKNTFEINTMKTGTLYLGTRKGKGYVTNKKSNLKAETISINAPNLDIVIMANVSCENLTVNAKSLTLYKYGDKSTSSVTTQITADKVVFAGDVKDIPSTHQIKVADCKEVVVKGGVKINVNMDLTNSALTVQRNASVSSLTLDDSSTAVIEGNIVSKIEGGKRVTMQEGHSCPNYQNVKTLIIFKDLNTTQNIANCENVIYVEKLAKPVEIIIEKRNNRIFCKVAQVKYASSYSFVVIDDEGGQTQAPDSNVSINANGDTECDVTDFVKTPGKSYTVTVTPKGNYYDMLDKLDDFNGTLYIDGDSISVKYNYVITLPMPTGLNITSAKNEAGITKTTLTFDQVADANGYVIFIDGKEIKGLDFTTSNNKVSADISQYVNKVGDHYVRVKAVNTQNDNIKDSQFTLIGLSTTEKLNAVEVDDGNGNGGLKATITEDVDDDNQLTASITVNWKGVQNGYEYLIELKINDGNEIKKIQIGRTSIINSGNVGYSIKFSDLTDVDYDRSIALNGGYEIIVTAIGHGYFTDSDSITCSATLPQSPSNPDLDGDEGDNSEDEVETYVIQRVA
ncbi:MAG: cofactor-independent phosphoglycerate mutase [Clostridia bacterium]|nr:cofactor-independent phosphoglycerate mutase [Clostridia bacterium]